MLQPVVPHPEPIVRKAITRVYSTIETRPVEWLVPGWIPLGKLTVLDGDPGLGKSTLLLDIAARITTHGVGLNQKQGPTGKVVLLSAEDTPEDTIRPRLQAAGANLDNIIDLSHIVIGERERPPEIPADLDLIEAVVNEHAAKLLIIEPLLAFVAGADANKDQEIRRVLYKLSKVAERQHCACTTMRHLNKSSSGKAIYRGNMSIGVIGHARVGLLVAQDPDDETKRILAMPKINCGPQQPSMRFALEPVGNVCRIGWCGQSPYKADDLVSQPLTGEEKAEHEEKAIKVHMCKELMEILLGEGAQPVKDVKKELTNAGFTNGVVYRAQLQLGISLTYEVVSGVRVYKWQLP